MTKKKKFVLISPPIPLLQKERGASCIGVFHLMSSPPCEGGDRGGRKSIELTTTQIL